MSTNKECLLEALLINIAAYNNLNVMKPSLKRSLR